MANEPRGVPVPYPAQPPRGQMTPSSGSPLLQGSGQADTRVTIRMRPGSGIGVEYLGEIVKISLDASTLAEMPPGYDGQYYTIVYDPETGEAWRVEAVAGGAIPPHKHPESDITGLLNDLAIRPIDAPVDDVIYGRQNGFWVAVGGLVQWNDIQNKPSTFPPDAHTHPIAEVDLLTETLDDVATSLQTLYDTKIEEAPLTGEQFARQSGDWVAVLIPPPLDAYTKTQSDARYVDVAGDTMTGALVLPNGTQTAPSLGIGSNTTGLYGSTGAINFTVTSAIKAQMSASYFNISLPVRGANNTAALPTFSWQVDTTSGIYLIAAGQVGLSISGVLRWTWTATGATTTVPITLPSDPTAALHAATKQYVDTYGVRFPTATMAETNAFTHARGLTLTDAATGPDGYPTFASFLNIKHPNANDVNRSWSMGMGADGVFWYRNHHTTTWDAATGINVGDTDLTDDWSRWMRVWSEANFDPTTKVSEAPLDGKTYGRKNAAWVLAAGAAQIADAAPGTGDHGTFWWDSDSGGLYIRYQDTDSTAWISTGTGPQGVKGDKGDKGDQGIQGPQGIQGVPGGGLTQAQGDTRYVNVDGDTMTGPLRVNKVGDSAIYFGAGNNWLFWNEPSAVFQVNHSFMPDGTGLYDLGHADLRWRTVFTSDLSLSNGIGDWTIVEGEDDLFLYNNKKGKVYKFALTEVDPSNAPKKVDDGD